MDYILNDPDVKKDAQKIARAYNSTASQWKLRDAETLTVILADGRKVVHLLGQPLPEPKAEPEPTGEEPQADKPRGRRNRSDAPGPSLPDA